MGDCHRPRCRNTFTQNIFKYLTGTIMATQQFETPFSDTLYGQTIEKESEFKTNYSLVFQVAEDSPFSRTYNPGLFQQNTSLAQEEFVSLLAELNNREFAETLFDLAHEFESHLEEEVKIEFFDGESQIVKSKFKKYIDPVVTETHAMIDKVSDFFTENQFSEASETEFELYLQNLEFEHIRFSPAQEQFLGKVFDKVKSVAKKGIELAKKGVNAVGKILPIQQVLEKIKGLVRPLLERILKFSIGKLPKNLQPHAQNLAKKFLKLEFEVYEFEGTDDLEAIQYEFDVQMTQYLFGGRHSSNELVTFEFEYFDEHATSPQVSKNDGESLHLAKSKLIQGLQSLEPDGDPTQLIENFLPVAIAALHPAIKIAINIAGRQRVIAFLADILAKLIRNYVPESVTKPLASSIIDLGMGAIGFEVHEQNRADLGYEAIVNTLEQTVRDLNLDSIQIDNENLASAFLESFEKAASENFPPKYIKEELRSEKTNGLWVAMPRSTPRKRYKKFSRVFDVVIPPRNLAVIKTFRGLPLANFLTDKYGIETNKPIKAKVHLYELLNGGRLDHISNAENIPGLNKSQPKSWVQLLPLTREASTIIFGEPTLGREVSPDDIRSRYQNEDGKRFYFLELEEAKLRIPAVNRSSHRHINSSIYSSITESRSADVQAVIDFIKAEIKFNYFFSEEDAKRIVEKLNKNDFTGTALSIRNSFKKVFEKMLKGNISSKVKIVHESIPELYLNYRDVQQEDFVGLANLVESAGQSLIRKIIEQIVEVLSQKAYHGVLEYFKTRAKEFKEAQAQPQDGVTLRVTWSNIVGLSTFRQVISTMLAKGPFGSLADLSVPQFRNPTIKIFPGKKFE
ncbi:hypothetical protein [Mariniradius sediminis]|uniref:Uncharacterized protein n=1 Tax=Mariniradius sediminis TaxID=2909237 RepID=A0ABS9BYH0_9BACT|nr:hypothetical protein [Mariniradius sediminis]MCF1752344.1 hypothetical protein [Mariniradius sediminis]